MLLVIVAVSGALFPGHAQTNSPAALGPRITFESLDYDFGKVDSGAEVKHEFVFTNTGDQVLEVTGVRTSCGCTTAGEWAKHVEPNQTGRIPVQFNSRGFGGSVHKNVFVTCNDSNQPNLTLNIHGTIWKQIDAVPQYAIFNMPPEGPNDMTQMVKIVNNTEEPVTVSDPRSGNPAFQVELTTVKEGKEYELKVVALASKITGNSSSTITCKTTSEKMPQLIVNAFAMMPPLLVINPGQITLPPGPLTNAMQFTVMVQNNGTNLISLSEPKISAADVDFKPTEKQPGRIFQLTLSFPVGFQCQTGQQVQASVKTSSPKHPLITIPVLQPAPSPVKPMPAPGGGTSAAKPEAGETSIAARK